MQSYFKLYAFISYILNCFYISRRLSATIYYLLFSYAVILQHTNKISSLQHLGQVHRHHTVAGALQHQWSMLNEVQNKPSIQH